MKKLKLIRMPSYGSITEVGSIIFNRVPSRIQFRVDNKVCIPINRGLIEVIVEHETHN